MTPQYKFVELSIVTDETIEEVVNEWVGKGWALDGIRFAMSDASRRPAMAFISFVRDTPPAPALAVLPDPPTPIAVVPDPPDDDAPPPPTRRRR